MTSMASVLLIVCTVVCVILLNIHNDVDANAFPLEDCWNSRIDLLLIAHRVKNGLREQMRLFSLLIDLFQDSEQIELHRLRVAAVVYRIIQPNRFQYRHIFDYSKYDNKTEMKEFLEHISYEDLQFDSYTFNSTFENIEFSTIFNEQQNEHLVSVMVIEYSQISGLSEDSLKHLNEYSKLFLIIVDDVLFSSSKTIDLPNYMRVNNYASLEHVQEIPIRLCDVCFPEWFGFKQYATESLVWTYSCYNLVYYNRVAWNDALKLCEKRQSSLASIETPDELDFIRLILTNRTEPVISECDDGICIRGLNIQIGLVRDLKSLSKRFRWINNAPLTVTHWLSNKHPNGGYVQSCGAWVFTKYEGDGWDDYGCGYTNAHFYLCETNVVTYNPGYVSNTTVKNSSSERVHAALIRGELARCPGSNALVSTSGIIGGHNNGDCAVLSHHVLETLNKLSPFIALFDCEDQQRTFIAYIFVCDHKVQCPNERDEAVCRYRQCDQLSEFTCISKQCVPSEARCDLYKDCYDGSDEADCTDCKYMRCQDGTCLPTHWWYDDDIDCIWQDVTAGYSWNIDHPNERSSNNCAFMCNRTQCVNETMMNNNVIDCTGPEGALDETVGALEKYNCHYDTPDHNLESWSPNCVYFRDRYDSLLGCRNMMHLQECRDFICSEGYLKCPGSYCIPMHQAHDGRKDCPYGEDEMRQFFPKCEGNFLCMRSRICVHIDQVCDGYPHCPKGDDELNCHMLCMKGFICVGGAVTVYDYNKNTPLLSLNFIDPRTRFIDLSGVMLAYVFPIVFVEVSLENLNVLRLSNCSIESLDYLKDIESGKRQHIGEGRFKLASVHTMDLSYNNIKYINENSIIKVMYNLRVLNLSHNKKLQDISRKAFELPVFTSYIQVLDLSHTQISTTLNIFDPLLNLTHLNLSHTLLSDLKPGTFSNVRTFKLQVLDLTGISITDFYSDTFSGVSISSGLYTDTYRLCCPQVRGPGIDSDVCHAPADPLSTCSDLMGDGVKRILLWLIAFLAIFGNLVVIVYRIQCTRQLLKKAYGMFVVHLAVSDVIMGAYLLIVASADAYYRNVYIWNEKRWRHHTLCQIAGFLSLLSSEVSTCFVFMITVERFLVLKYPFSNLGLSSRITAMMCLLIWFLGFAIAFVPLLPKFEHWTTYNSNGMCLGLPLTSQRLPGWQFSSSIFIGFNFVMFLLIFLGQISIYQTITDASRKSHDLCGVNNARQQQDFAAARQLFLIAISNFMCWFPIGVMGIMSLQGYEIGLAAFAWSAVLIMPINSALNPVLYSIPALLIKLATLKRRGIPKASRMETRHLCSKCQASFIADQTENEKVTK